MDKQLDEDDINNLKEYLSKNINLFKNFSTYEKFIVEFPSIKLQVDRQSTPIIVKSYYEKIYEPMFELITNTYNLKDCIINFNTSLQKLEIVDTQFKGIFDINDIVFVNCTIDSGVFNNCAFADCDVKNAHIYKSKTDFTNAFNCKIELSTVGFGSELHDCYLDSTILNGYMESGVLRSGRVGETGEIGPKVRIVDSEVSYFGDTEGEKDKKKVTELEEFKGKKF